MIGGVQPGGSASVAFAGVKKATIVKLATVAHDRHSNGTFMVVVIVVRTMASW